MDEAGVDAAAVILPCEVVPRNQAVARAARGHSRLIGVPTMDPRLPDAAEQYDELISEWGMRGLQRMPRIHGFQPSDPVANPLMETARRHGFPLTVRSGGAGGDIPAAPSG